MSETKAQASVVISEERRDADPGYAQALLDQADAEVRRVALKCGVESAAMGECLRDFARELVPHAGRAASVHPVSHYKRWFKGWARGWARGRHAEGVFTPSHQLECVAFTADEALRHLSGVVADELASRKAEPTRFVLEVRRLTNGNWRANAEWVEPKKVQP